MSDDTKKPGRGTKARGSGPRGERPRDSSFKAGPKRARPDGDAKPFRKREQGEGGGQRFERKEGDRPPFRKSEDSDRKPYRARPDGDAKPFRKREQGEGGQRFERKEGDRPPFRKNEDGDRKPFRARGDGDAKPFRKREQGETGRKPYRKSADAQAAPRDSDADTASPTGESERIARRLARAGVASRRDAEAMIAEGRITLNGKVLDTPAVNVGMKDRIEIDGKPIPAVERTRLFLFHKPAGIVTTNRDPQGRTTVFDVLPKGLPRLMTVGRLDINTEGLLLLTNDGGLSRVLELPATGWLRRYRVRVHGKVQPEALESLKEGIAVDGVFYGSVEATLDREQGSNAWLTIGLREGKNREVKNILGALGLDVTRLIRLSYGPFQLGELAEGEVRELKGKLLREQLGDRLVAESGANFDAPVINEFSNKPVSARAQEREEDTGPRLNKKREREQKREEALERLQTSPQRPDKSKFGEPRGDRKGGDKKFGDKKFGDKPKFGDKKFSDKPKFGDKKFGDKPGFKKREEREEVARPRSANVWMAPGARPVGEKKAAAMAERRFAGKPRPKSEGGGKPGGKFGAGPKGPRKPRGDRS